MSADDLPVPDEAVKALRDLVRASQRHDPGVISVDFEDVAATAVRAIAGPVVAAELRRLRDDLISSGIVQPSLRERFAEMVDARADALDPPA